MFCVSAMDVNVMKHSENKDGGQFVQINIEAPSISPKRREDCKRKRRGKYKRKIKRPIAKMSWQQRRKHDNSKRKFRKLIMSKTNAPYNNNQFLMEIHKPEPDNKFECLKTPPRTRDSSFSVDSDENYFYSIPDDEEEYLTKEFSSVYEDAQSERLSNMSKTELVQEYLLLEAKYENLVKKTERSKQKVVCYENSVVDKDASTTDKDSITDKDLSLASNDTINTDCSLEDLILRLKEQEKQIQDLQNTNEKLKIENEALRKGQNNSSSEDSESDSSSTSVSESSSSRSLSPLNTNNVSIEDTDQEPSSSNILSNESVSLNPVVNGFHVHNETLPANISDETI